MMKSCRGTYAKKERVRATRIKKSRCSTCVSAYKNEELRERRAISPLGALEKEAESRTC